MSTLDFLNSVHPYVRWVKIQKSLHLNGHWVDEDHVFTFIAAGRAAFVLDGEQYSVGEGDVVIIPAGVRHIICSEVNMPFSEYIFHFDLYRDEGRTLGMMWGRDPNAISGPIPAREMVINNLPMVIRPPHEVSSEIRSLYLKLHREAAQQHSLAQGMVSAYAKAILINAYRCTSQMPRQRQALTSWNSIQHIIDTIQLRYNDPTLSIAVLAKLVGYTPNYVSTLMKDNLGITIHEYITYVRTEVAKQLLYESAKSVSEIAELVGYASVQAFSRAFKRTVGASPTQYAHNFRIANSAVSGTHYL